MADTNTSVSAISTDNLEIDSYDDVVKTKPDLADLGRRASVAAGATVRDGVDDGGIKL